MTFVYLLAVLACPVGMGLMMWFMMRPRHPDSTPVDDAAREREIAGLQAQLDQLRADQARGLEPRPPRRVRLGKS